MPTKNKNNDGALQQQINLKDLDLSELKALAYDQIIQLQILQQNVNLLQAEIARREQEQDSGTRITPD